MPRMVVAKDSDCGKEDFSPELQAVVQETQELLRELVQDSRLLTEQKLRRLRKVLTLL